MMKKTTLSASGTVQRKRSSRVADPKALTSTFLIANPRLEFRLTHTKQSSLIFSNRERIAICRVVFVPGGRSFSSSVNDRNWRSVQDRHPERPSGVEGTLVAHPHSRKLSRHTVRPCTKTSPSPGAPISASAKLPFARAFRTACRAACWRAGAFASAALVTCHSSPVTGSPWPPRRLIYGAAIRNPRKP